MSYYNRPMKDEEDSDAWIEHLILEGGIEVSAVDENGELLYSFTDKLKEVDPKLYQKAYEKMYMDAKLLWIEGFLEMDITSNNPKVHLNRKSFDRQAISKLPPELQTTLYQIIEALLQE
jgi:hypothetical protein